MFQAERGQQFWGHALRLDFARLARREPWICGLGSRMIRFALGSALRIAVSMRVMADSSS